MKFFNAFTKPLTVGFVLLQALLFILAVTNAVPVHILKPISISLALLYAALLIIKGKKK